MKRTLLLTLLLALVLSACGRTTRLNADISVSPFLSDADKQGEGFLAAGLALDLPDEEGIDGSELGLPSDVLENLDRLELDFSTDLTLSSTTDDITASLELYVSDSAPVFATEPIRAEAALSPDVKQSVDFNLALSSEENAELFKLLQSGDFRFSARIATSSDNPKAVGKVSSEITAFNLRFSADLSSTLSF